MVEIRTDRLLLRPATESDVGAFYDILGNKSAMAYWSTPPHKSMAETHKWLSSMINIVPGQGEDFVVELNRKVIGKVGLYQFPEVGFILHPDAWGKGYAREALDAVLTRAFAWHGLSSVRADVDPRNSASLGLLARLGFEEVGRASRTWQVGGRWCDSIYLQRDNPDSRGG